MLSVIVPTHNRCYLLRKLIDAVAAQSMPHTDFELIIVDDGSIDDTPELLEKTVAAVTFRLIHLRQVNRGPAAARNLGLSRASGEIIVFTDDDCVPDPNWLDELNRYLHSHPTVIGCGGRIRRIQESSIGRFLDRCGAFHHPLQTNGAVAYLVTANAAYRREAFEKAGGFCETITWPGGEDPELSYRVRGNGGRLGFCPTAAIRHHHRDDFTGVYKMFFCHGRGRVAIAIGSGKKSQNGFLVFMLFLASGIKSSVVVPMSPWDRIVHISCAFVGAIGFSRGVAFQSRLGANTTENHPG